MAYTIIVLEQIGTFVIYALLGVAAVKSSLLSRQDLNLLSRLITKMILPLLIFTNAINGTTRRDFLNSLSILIITAVLYVILYLTGLALSKILRLSGNRRNIYRVCMMFGNCGFMGIPIITTLFPERGGMYIAVFSVVDQLVLWTIGNELCAPCGEAGKRDVLQTCRKMINPAMIAIILGVTVLLTGFPIPSFINKALTRTGAAATPLAMIYLGGMFCFIHITDYLKRKEIYFMAVGKMVLLPVIFYTALNLIPVVSQEIAVTISLICALPSMASIAMIAESQNSDSDYASGIIFITTLLSAVTIPAVCMLF